MKILFPFWLTCLCFWGLSLGSNGEKVMSTYVDASARSHWMEFAATEIFGELEDPAEEGFEAAFWQAHARRWMESWLVFQEERILEKIAAAGLSVQALDTVSLPACGYGGRALESLSAEEKESPLELTLLIDKISPREISCPLYQVQLTVQVISISAFFDQETLCAAIAEILSSPLPSPEGLASVLVRDEFWYLTDGTPKKLMLAPDDLFAFGYSERIMLYDDFSFTYEPLKPTHTIDENDFLLMEENEDAYAYWRKGVWKINEGQLTLFYPGESAEDLDGIKSIVYQLEKETDTSFLLHPKEP